MRRRALLLAALGAWSASSAHAHTPYRQWTVYRRRHLIVGTSREDAASYPTGKAVAEVLVTHLPESSARVTRARTAYRLASLVGTDQLRVALFERDRAERLVRGEGEFAGLGPVALRVLYRFDDLLLVSRPDFPDHHAWLVSRTLVEHGAGVPGARAPETDGAIALHPGTAAVLRGEAAPGARPWTDGGETDHPHS